MQSVADTNQCKDEVFPHCHDDSLSHKHSAVHKQDSQTGLQSDILCTDAGFDPLDCRLH